MTRDLEWLTEQTKQIDCLANKISEGFDMPRISRASIKTLDQAGLLEKSLASEYNHVARELASFGVGHASLKRLIYTEAASILGLTAVLLPTPPVVLAPILGVMIGGIGGLMAWAGITELFSDTFKQRAYRNVAKNLSTVYEKMCVLERVATEGCETLKTAIQHSEEPYALSTAKDVLEAYTNTMQATRQWITDYEKTIIGLDAKDEKRLEKDQVYEIFRETILWKSKLTKKEADKYITRLRALEPNVSEKRKELVQILIKAAKARTVSLEPESVQKSETAVYEKNKEPEKEYEE